METKNKKKAAAAARGASLTGEDVKSILIGLACVVTVLLIRYAIYLPAYLR
ncbi:MAG: hypothetical protein ACI4OI_00145 [Gemmiger sp.]